MRLATRMIASLLLCGPLMWPARAQTLASVTQTPLPNVAATAAPNPAVAPPAPPGGAAPNPSGPNAASPPAPAPATPTIPQPPGPAADVWVPAGTAELRVMNKVDSHPSTLMLPVGQQAQYGSLTISVKSCLARPADQNQDWAAYLDIVDSHQDEPSFHGWTLANEPWIGMLEHPIYDVHLIACH